MKAASHLIVAISCLLLASCASLTEDRCVNSNWEVIGQRDGREGRADSSRNIEDRCARVGIEINRRAYVRGYLTGLSAFCSKENGKYMGMQGQQYDRQCPLELESKFLEGYYEGRSFYERLKTQRELYASIRPATGPMSDNRVRRCEFDSECQIPSACQDGRCNSTGVTCRFNSDCTTKGSCLENRCDFPSSW